MTKMHGFFFLAMACAIQTGWHYGDDEVQAIPTARTVPQTQTPAPAPLPDLKPLRLPEINPAPVKPAPAPTPAPSQPEQQTEERRPTAAPGPHDIDMPKACAQSPTRDIPLPPMNPAPKVPVKKVCRPARWRLKDATGKVWVAYDRSALITHVQTVNAAYLVPSPIEVTTSFVSTPVIVDPPTTVISTPVTTIETYSTPIYSTPVFSAPLVTSPVYGLGGGGCAGGMCR